MKLHTLFLKITVVIIGLPVLVLCLFGLTRLANVSVEYASLLYPVLIGMYISSIPFFIALYQAFKLLSYIDKDNAFSEVSVMALKNIKYCGIIIGVIYGVCMPFIFLIAEKDDAPGLVLIGLAFTFASIVVAVFASVLQKLLEDVIDRVK